MQCILSVHCTKKYDHAKLTFVINSVSYGFSFSNHLSIIADAYIIFSNRSHLTAVNLIL